jgi:hypothetical protein
MQLLEKLIENWLDSTSERSYQPIFCQALVNRGYQIIHSTRHNAQEHGKDIIARNSDGELCAFQLKGHPRKMLGLSQYNTEIVPQLNALANLPVDFPGLSDTKHKSYFVTNGQIDEVVWQAIRLAHLGNDQDDRSHRNVTFWVRGDLLKMFLGLDVSLWPGEVDDSKLLLEIITHNGDELYPIEKFHEILGSLVRLKKDSNRPNQEELNRIFASAALLTGICLGPFEKKENHWAACCAWAILGVYIIAAEERWQIKTKQSEFLLTTIKEVVFSKLELLSEEVILRKDKSMGEGDMFSDYFIVNWRHTLIKSILSYYSFVASDQGTDSKSELISQLNEFILDGSYQMDVWGEAALPGMLFYNWAVMENCEVEAANQLAIHIFKLCAQSALPAIYYDAEQIIRHRLSNTLTSFVPSINTEALGFKNSWFGRQAFFNMVNLNMADDCEGLWTDYCQSRFTEFIPASKWGYCLYRTDEGINIGHVVPDSEKWDDLRSLGRKIPDDVLPLALISESWLLGLWIMICPSRAITSVTNYLFWTLTTINKVQPNEK